MVHKFNISGRAIFIELMRKSNPTGFGRISHQYDMADSQYGEIFDKKVERQLLSNDKYNSKTMVFF